MATVLFTPCSLLPVPIIGFLYTLTTDTLYKHVNMHSEHTSAAEGLVFTACLVCDVDNLLIRFF